VAVEREMLDPEQLEPELAADRRSMEFRSADPERLTTLLAFQTFPMWELREPPWAVK
jgi:hypothetical protein